MPPPRGIVSPMAKPVHHGPRNDHGLVLDDYLNAVADVRRRFQLTLPTIDLAANEVDASREEDHRGSYQRDN